MPLKADRKRVQTGGKWPGYDALALAAHKGKTAVVKLLIASADLGPAGRLAELHCAAAAADHAALRSFRDQRELLNTRMNGRSAMNRALCRGRTDTADFLRRLGADVSATNLGSELLTVAEDGCLGPAEALGAVAWLMDNGADINAQDSSGRTPADVAAQFGKVACVEKLLGVESTDDGKGEVLTRTDITEDEVELTRAIAEANAGDGGSARLRAYRRSMDSVERHLRLQLGNKRFETALELINCWADVVKPAADGWWPLALVAGTECAEGETADGRELNLVGVIGCILKRQPNARWTDPHGATALHHAALRGHVEISRMLVKAGADPTVVARSGCFQGKSALDVAMASGNVDVVHVLGSSPDLDATALDAQPPPSQIPRGPEIQVTPGREPPPEVESGPEPAAPASEEKRDLLGATGGAPPAEPPPPGARQLGLEAEPESGVIPRAGPAMLKAMADSPGGEPKPPQPMPERAKIVDPASAKVEPERVRNRPKPGETFPPSGCEPAGEPPKAEDSPPASETGPSSHAEPPATMTALIQKSGTILASNADAVLSGKTPILQPLFEDGAMFGPGATRVISPKLLIAKGPGKWRTSEFTKAAVGKSPTLLLVKSEFGQICGGVNTAAWMPEQCQGSLDKSLTSFLFCLGEHPQRFRLRKEGHPIAAVWWDGLGLVLGGSSDLFVTCSGRIEIGENGNRYEGGRMPRDFTGTDSGRASFARWEIWQL